MIADDAQKYRAGIEPGDDLGRAGQVVHRTILMFAFNTSFWRDRRVLVTGHTGFKGAWLVLWLTGLGARVTGLSLPPRTDPSLFALCRRCTRIATATSHPAIVARALVCEPEIGPDPTWPPGPGAAAIS